MDTIQIDGWQGRLGLGLAPRQLLATLYAAKDMTAKQIAKHMDCSPSTINKQLESARYNLSDHPNYIRTVRGLCLEAMRRGIIAPLMVALLIGGGNVQQIQPVRRPDSPRAQTVVRIQRLDEAQLAA
ncbi:helix-turn-helix domain-containing protein [Stutzerimonas nitrititolerans]|uniref:helix-turn-helix domain-containing protein n=1 Tax=Stutzerimonas nitrititolerans TaxID=2482751 RepID=UPI0028ACB344|nr:helix-turn-helix domain-containing protein [Stutzerimonas nitrititolerans]